ncbi:MAG: T9SS type A sorting domain-containing protein [Saprospiraceae bacterium]
MKKHLITTTMFTDSFYQWSNLSSKGANFKIAAILCSFFILIIPDINGQNLISNPGAESDPTSNGWTIVSEGTNCFDNGNWRINGGLNGFPVAQSGDYIFYPGCGGARNGTQYEVYQDVDVSFFAATIDAGNQTFNFSGYSQVFEQETNDGAQIIVEYRNPGGTVLDYYDTGENNLGSVWTLYTDTRTAPVGTRAVRVRLIAYSRAGTSIDGYFDVLSLCTDGDGLCNEVDDDYDNDGINDLGDNCPLIANADQLDSDTDGAGDACDASFSVCIAITSLETAVEALPTTSDGTKAFLLNKLNIARDKFATGNNNAATGNLGAFINKVNAKSPDEISQEDADALIAAANAIINGINSGQNDCDGSVQSLISPGNSGNLAYDVVKPLSLEVYPNPARDRVNIRFAAIDAKTQVVIYNLHGKQVWMQETEPYQEVLDVDLSASQFETGFYTIRVSNEHGTEAIRIVINK